MISYIIIIIIILVRVRTRPVLDDKVVCTENWGPSSVTKNGRNV